QDAPTFRPGNGHARVPLRPRVLDQDSDGSWAVMRGQQANILLSIDLETKKMHIYPRVSKKIREKRFY
ncbi:hypothetical protein DFH28DRAFT_839886, partial [Melampsora americana]